MDIKRLLRKEVSAPLWRRVVAYVIDAAVLTLILLPLQPSIEAQFTSFSAFYDYFASRPSVAWQFSLTLIITLLFSLAYWSILEYKYQQTLGKFLLGIYVVSKQKTLTYKQCLLRNIAKLSTLLLLLDSLYLFFKHTNQRYSETLAGTDVMMHYG